MCVLGWAGGVPVRPIFMEKTQKNEVFRHGLRMGRVALCRLIIINLSYKTPCKIRVNFGCTDLNCIFLNIQNIFYHTFAI